MEIREATDEEQHSTAQHRTAQQEAVHKSTDEEHNTE